MNILLLTTGSVSAYLSHKLAVALEEDGHEVKHYMTKTAGDLMSMNKDSRSKNPECQCFYTNHYSNYISVEREALDWRDKAGHPIHHIDLVKWADICVVCPADYNVVGKMANGIADDFISSILAAWMGCGKKLYICESMNSMMYQGPVYQRNRAYLDSLDSVRFIEPTVKNLACGGASYHFRRSQCAPEAHRRIRRAGYQPLRWLRHDRRCQPYHRQHRCENPTHICRQTLS